VVDELRRLGFGVRPRRRLSGLQKKALALWIELGSAGKLRDRSDRALDRFVLRQTGIAALPWLTPDAAAQLVETLKAWCRREGIAIDE
jgi:hypothetical protein